MKNIHCLFLMTVAFCIATLRLQGQATQETTGKAYKNVIRYDLSGALLYGPDRHIVFGYERVLKNNQSISINVGKASLFTADRNDIKTDSFSFNDDLKNNGFKINADYRFYLKKENKYQAPHGVFIGPYAAFAQFKRDNQWAYTDPNSQGKLVQTNLTMNIFTVGGEMGYQFILGKRVALDFVLIGPGFGYYKINAKIKSDLSQAQKEELRGAIKDLITEKFPGLNNILANKNFDNEGDIRTWNFGYRYIIHIGYVF
ncbi:DUF3575 domain-containing protein [Chitinophagaceae bacterium LB-8]|uniref:DUF3575 domain-containing protein n=1 Tax=Paraflavisolibacter caeni TaxID=2982496 RepID=A0A9X2XVA6_9BACT|nr:DUF3575 domain-containing protein [Paraflavisolibacter caeni]MCU7549400.1 DUF3575 domain-containing protein [Paraflavisolibacter caeni]